MPHINTNGIRLFYEERGAGDPVLLIMGITATGSVWEKHVTSWEKDFRCIIVDNRGVGLSDIPPGPYTSALMADDYAGLLETLQIENVRVVGCSMGSIIAQQLAIRHPEKVRSMVLMCPWARCDARAKAIFQNMIDCKARLRPEEFSLYIQLLIFSKKYWDNQANVATLEKDRIQSAMELNPQSLPGLQSQAEACMAHNVLGELVKIRQPVLVIGGSEDIFTPVWMTEEVAVSIPNASLHLYDSCGHAFHWEAIDDFNPRIRRWLSDH